MRALTVKQPWADLIMAGVKDVENRTWPVPSTLPQWWRCPVCVDRGRWEFTAPLDDVPGCVGRHAAVDMVPDGPFPFRLTIHAGKQHAYGAMSSPLLRGMALNDLTYPRNSPDRYGALLGTVTVTGCHHADECWHPRDDYAWPSDDGEAFCSRWAEPDVCHWTLTDPEPFRIPVPMMGRQRLWRLPDDALERADQLASGAYV